MAISLSISCPHTLSINLLLLKPKPRASSAFSSPTLSFISPLPSLFERSILCRSRPRKDPQNLHRSWRISAVAEDSLSSDAQQIVTTSGDDGVSTIISSLLFFAFVGLSILTIGVIYIAVTDYLQKREGEKFAKEEAAKKKKKGGKKGKARARTGPKGFGQKIEEEDDFDD